MTDTAWIIFAAILALSFASLTVRGVLRYRGRELAIYILTVVVLGVLGGAISLSIDGDHLALGIAIGVGLVELGPTLVRATKAVVHARAKRLERE